MPDRHSNKTDPAKSTGKSEKSQSRTKKKFSLTLHPSGQWCKRVLGKLHYFGKDADQALQRWLDEKDDLVLGRKPRKRKRGSYSLEDAVNLHLEHINGQVQRGEKSPRWFEDMKCNGSMVLAALGRSWSVDALTPEDFAVLRKRFAEKGLGKKKTQASHTTVNNRIIRTRTMFNWLVKAGVLERVPEYGTAFDPPDVAARENERLDRGSKDFTRQQVRSLLRHSKEQPELHAAILLAVNTGCQNVDIETLKRCHIDLDNGWYVQPRAKRAKRRRAKLWSRTVKALRAVIGERELADDDPVFVGKSGGKWHGRNCLAKEFADLKKRAGITKLRCGFQWLRHTFITQASQGGDLVAVQLAVGHADRSITLRYIHSVYDPRLVAISAMVDAWLVGSGVQQ